MKKSWNRGLQSSADQECAAYFRERPVFDRILRGFRGKYASYGSFSGTVTVRNLSEEDLEDLEGFFQKNYHGQKSVSVSAERFHRALRDSRFEGVDPKELLEQYFHEPMTGKKEQEQAQKKEEDRKRRQMFMELRASYADTWAEPWLAELEQAKNEMQHFVFRRCREADKDLEEAKRLLLLGCRILCSFPYHRETTEYLAVFAAVLTGNPHAFDDGTKDGYFLSLLVRWDTERRRIVMEKSGIFPSLQKQRLYLAAGILRDDISNYVMLSGILARKKNGNIHRGMEGFRNDGDPVQVPLSVIAGWERVQCPDREIYIVENPSVFAMFCGKWKGKKACMCMNGQPRLSAVLMLDLLADSGVKVYYAGDFDPEGLLIAWKVKQYYKGEAVYWHMSAREYEKSRSMELISEKRLKMLERIQDDELAELVEAMQKSGAAGYQENVCRIYLDEE